MSARIYPVILCGGEGMRLWPLLQKSFPKQFIALFGQQSLLQTTVKRFSGSDFKNPIIITHRDFRFIVQEQLAEIDVVASEIIIEPRRRDTAAAIAAVLVMIAQNDPEAILLVTPSDNLIDDATALQAAIKPAIAAAKNNNLVTFGIYPDRAASDFGYIILGDKLDSDTIEAQPFEKFIEKPDLKTAQNLIDSRCSLWNSGMFMLSVGAGLAAFKKHAPTILQVTQQAIINGSYDLDFFCLSQHYNTAECIAFDYAIMEKTTGIVVPLSCQWNDLGNWKTIWQKSAKDAHGVATDKTATAIACQNTLLKTNNQHVQLVGIGLKNIVVVAMCEAILVMDMASTQLVKRAVDNLKINPMQQAKLFYKHHRPWGWYQILTVQKGFHVKTIVIKPQGRLSLQSHHGHHAEHWVVVRGCATVTINKSESRVMENQSVYIPPGIQYDLENCGTINLHIIEVQTGSYRGEDDIMRYHDMGA